MNNTFLAAAIAAPAALAGSAVGGYAVNQFQGGGQAQEDALYADVVSVTPYFETVSVSVPRQDCDTVRTERVVPQERGFFGKTEVQTVIGGVIGAAIGNQIGSGRGRDLATGIGGLGGAALGANNAKRQARRNARVVVDSRQVCRTVTDQRSEQRQNGYDVTYRYQGQLYTTRTEQRPGARLPIALEAKPTQL